MPFDLAHSMKAQIKMAVTYSCEGDIVLKSNLEVTANQNGVTLPPASACWVKISG